MGRKIFLRSLLLFSLGGMIHAADITKKPSGLILSDLAAPRALTVPEAGCLVWQKPVYCLNPGDGYRIVVENGRADGSQQVRRWRIFLDGSDFSAGAGGAAAPVRKECPVRLDARTEVRLLLEGEAGSFVRCWIEGEALPPVIRTITQADGTPIEVRSMTVGRAPGIKSVRPLSFDPGNPDPAIPSPRIEFAADRTALAIGEAVTLSWRVEGAAQATLFLPGHLEAPASGCAQIFPESDTTMKVSAMSRGGRAEKEIRLAVVVPEPELTVTIEPKSIDLGQQAVLSWKSRNARMVHFAGSPYSPLPLSGSMTVKGCGGGGSRTGCPFTLEADCGARKVSRSVWLEVIDRAALKREQEEEARREARLRAIDPQDDKVIRSRWQEFCRAMAMDDADAAAACLPPERREPWRKRFAEIRARFNARNWNSLQLYFGQHDGNAAMYVLGPAHARGGEDFHDEDVVYFMCDAQGAWWLYM